MSGVIKVLVSNIALPSESIGSWTTRMSQLLADKPNLFDVILSPNSKDENFVFCKKRSFITWKRPFRKVQLRYLVALDYIKQVKRLVKQYDRLVVVIMDDPHLVEAFGHLKNRLKNKIELVYSFHGFQLGLNDKALSSIDKVLFLSKSGLEKSMGSYSQFPKSFVVGNSVDSKVFYPLNKLEFINTRTKLGYGETDEILIWMANDRPKKGFHIFKAVVEELLKTNKDLKVIIIGSKKSIAHKNVNSIGRIPNREVSKYLQIGNYYMFTTLYEEGFGLSMVEALKCGNTVIASDRGAIAEVLNGLENTYLVEDAEHLDSWIDAFNSARTNSNYGAKRLDKTETDRIWNYQDWQTKFVKAINC